MTIYLARWYVNGTADTALVLEFTRELALEVVKHNLEKLDIKPDRGYEKIRIAEVPQIPSSFTLLSDGGRV